MAVAAIMLQFKHNGRSNALGAITFKAKVKGKGIRFRKLCPYMLHTHYVRIILNYLHGLVAIGFIKAHGILRTKAVAAQKFHKAAQTQLALESFAHLQGFFHAYATKSRKLFRLELNNLQGSFAKLGDYDGGGGRANALYYAAGQIFINSVRTLGHIAQGILSLKLLSMAGMAHPNAPGFYLFAGSGKGQAAGYGYAVAGVCFQAQHRIAVFLVCIYNFVYSSENLCQFFGVHKNLRLLFLYPFGQQVFQPSGRFQCPCRSLL